MSSVFMERDSHLNALDQIYSYQKFEVDKADYLEFEKKVYFLERLAEVEVPGLVSNLTSFTVSFPQHTDL
jgi:hypothetical protein